MKLAILGAGAWGTAFGIAMAPRHRVSLWCRDEAMRSRMQGERRNSRYLPDVPLPVELALASDAAAVLSDCDLVVCAVPTAGLRESLKLVRRHAPARGVVWLCKGFEAGSAKFPHQVAAEELRDGARYAALSGPSFADEVARGLPAAVTLASPDAEFAAEAARELHTGRLRVYSTADLVGVETGGAVKNVMAIAAGVCDGLRLGNSARAALITRGLAEMTRLGVALGGRPETFMGLAGAGDLLMTATSDLSRNRRVGLGLGRGQALAPLLAELGHVAEGVTTAAEVVRLAAAKGVEMPIAAAVHRLLEGKISAPVAVEELMNRAPRNESGH
jgi:glycerol-3-phosphate dehydrogenase (NAD(P)+)